MADTLNARCNPLFYGSSGAWERLNASNAWRHRYRVPPYGPVIRFFYGPSGAWERLNTSNNWRNRYRVPPYGPKALKLQYTKFAAYVRTRNPTILRIQLKSGYGVHRICWSLHSYKSAPNPTYAGYQTNINGQTSKSKTQRTKLISPERGETPRRRRGQIGC